MRMLWPQLNSKSLESTPGQGSPIIPTGNGGGLALARIARVQVVAEVDLDHATEFWSSPIATQQGLLQVFALRGAKAVIAGSPKLDASNQAEWVRLGQTPYWVWRPSSQQAAGKTYCTLCNLPTSF